MRIVFNPLLCSGCKICQQVCSIVHFNSQNPTKARLKINTIFKPKGVVYHKSYICMACSDALCIQVCPTDALKRNKFGYIEVDVEKCIACWECTKVCPYNAIFMHPEIRYPLICDFCGGDPACVKWCPMGALSIRG